MLFAPGDGRRWNLLLDYMRGTLRSSLPFLAPQDRTSEISRYREDGHYGGATVEIHPVGRARIHLGGSLGVTAAAGAPVTINPISPWRKPVPSGHA